MLRTRPYGRALGIALCAVALLTASPSSAQEVIPPSTELPQQLSVAQAVNMFRARGVDLLIAEASVQAAQGDVQIAGAIPNPVVSLGYGRAFGGDPSSDKNSYSVGISDNAAIVDSLSGKRELRQRVARNALAAARLGRADALRVIESEVKQAYVQVALAAAQYEFAQRSVRLTDRLYSFVLANRAGGKFSEGDLARVRTQKLEAEQGVDQAVQALRQARVSLAFLLGVRGPVPDFSVDQSILTYAVPGTLASASEESLVRVAVDHRPDLRALGYQRARAEASIALARRQRFPDIALSVNYSQLGVGDAAISPPTVMIGVTTPIPLFYQQQGEIRRAEADYNTQSLQHAKTAAQVVSEVTASWAAYTSSKRLVERMERGGLLDSAETARTQTETVFFAGKIPVTDVLDATRSYFSIQLEYLQDLTNYWTAVYQLESAVGMELRQ